MEPKYDQRPPFEIIDLSFFRFHATRYEVWFLGSKVEAHNCQSSFSFSKSSDNEFYSIIIFGNPIPNRIDGFQAFDMAGTLNDRWILSTIPSNWDTEEESLLHSWFEIGKSFFGPTRLDFKPKSKQSYVCSIFTVDQCCKKVTFSMQDPDTLIEFYEM